MKVDLPTPGTPVMPSRTDLPLCGSSAPQQRVGALAMIGSASIRSG